MKRISLIFVAIIVLPLSGCVKNSNLVGLKGNDVQTGVSLKDMREARLGINVFPSKPETAYSEQAIEVQRCHQNFTEAPPSEKVMIDDLKINAYIQGFDGITNIVHTQESGLLKNCWYVQKAKALAFRIKQK